ncbi:MAG: NAD(P)/FAD-dependent oxidoreductase [Candidatus Diapherotrites archaeon]|nr:NAD(P)/FAD-dependent oxidoreductase [Candidatus Diapherotrites archaeon]
MTDLKDTDILVIGAGPGGLRVAIEAGKLGAKVTIVDKKQEIGVPKRCAEGLGGGWFKRLGMEPDPKWAVWEINNARVFSPNGKEIKIGKNQYGYVLERKMFEKYLASEAIRKGAKIKLKTESLSVIKEGSQVVGAKVNEMGDEYEIRAKVVIACDGVDSRMARSAGLDTTNKLVDMDSGFQYEMANIRLGDKHALEMYFGTDIAPRGYIWIFPKGEDVANVGIGIGGNSEKTAKYYLDKWIAKDPRFKDASPIEINAGGIPVGGIMDNMVLDGFMVVGDAAHQVNPMDGGGIALAQEAGIIAAQTAVEAIEKGDLSADFLSKYNRIWLNQRGNQLKKVWKVRQFFEVLSNDDMDFIAEKLGMGEDLLDFAFGNNWFTFAKLFVERPGLFKSMKAFL